MEAKLKEYRAIRRRKEIINNVKEKLEQSKQKVIKFLIPETFRNMERNKYRKEDEVLLLENEELQEPIKQSLIMEESIDATSETSEIESIVEENQESWRYFIIKWTTPKKKGEVSAYSVFNKNCVSIDGTLKAEELEKQMIYGVGSMRMV
ncbi:unnamed protein product [Euphydryas editha]|uniref:SAYSvFN domain-containing protein n=1 Tax=Euphydryas editha TaxID=104508 RepID=A0AAU9UAI8_EUPED|nr:unnamed protein product [Euphydryas editha]